MSLYSRLDRIAADVARLDRQLTSVSNHPQSQRTSVEGGSIDFNDSDGNLKAIVGEQDDGGNTINVISGPTPPTPVGFTVDVDHGKFIVHWSGDFDGDALAPSDWSRAEVHASQDPFFVPSRATARGSIVSAAGGEVTIGVLKGEWTIKMLAWSQAGKMSAPSAPVDVEVPGYGEIVLEEIDAANTEIKNGNSILVNAKDTLGGKLDSAFGQLDGINDDLSDLGDAVAGAVASANGKNTVHFDDHAPTPEDEGVAGDTWFVGQVGRPNDVVEATNYVTNPSLEANGSDWSTYSWTGSGARTQGQDAVGEWFYRLTASSALTGLRGRYHDVLATVKSGQKWTLSIHVRPSRTVSIRPQGEFRGPSGVVGSPQYGQYFVCPANVWTRIHMTITAVGDATTVRHQTYLHEATLQSGDTLDLDGEVIALGQLAPYFDGDTPSGATDNESHYRWTGTPHASTSEKYLPATDGLSDKWNVTAQYRHDGTDWVQVELSHNVISSVDIGALTVGSAAIKEAVIEKLFAEVVVSRMSVAEEFIGENAILTGAVTAPKITASEELWAKLGQFVKIRAEHIQSDALDFMVARGGTYLTSGGNGSWSDNGLFISSPDGTSLVRFPTDGTPLSLTASDVQIDRASIGELDVIEETVRSGGTLNLASGVTPPASPPELSLGWEPVAEFDRPSPGSSFDWLGLGAWGTKWVRAVNVLGSVGDTLDAFEVYSASGSFEKKISLDINPRAGVTVIGDVAYTIGPDQNPANAGKLWVHGFNLNTGARVARWQFTRFTLSNQAKIAIGNDGTNLVVAGVHPTSNTLYVMRYNPATGAQVGADMTDTSYDVQYTKELQGVYITGSVAYVAHAKDTRRYTISGGTLTRTDNGWRNPETDAAGLAFTTTPFLVAQSGELYRGSTFQDSTFEACYTWWDGTHETTPSPIAALDMQAARVVSVSLARRAGLQKRFYYRSGNGNWARQTLDQDVTSVTIYTPNPSASNYPPPTANSFPNADPALLTSTNQRFQVLGDGSGKWGPLTFNADGTMTSTAIPSWIPVTSFLNGSAPASFGFAPAYRIWPDGKVEWRGCVSVNNVTEMKEIITVPAAARPAQYVPSPASCNGGSGGGVAHIEVMQEGAPDKLRTRPVSGTMTWVSLDSFYYYKS